MKILISAQIHWHNAEVQYAWDLGRELAARGVEVHALTVDGSLAQEKAREAGLVAHGESGFNAKGLGALKAITGYARVYGLLERERYDAALLFRSEGMAPIAYACKKLGVPVIRVRGDMRPVKKGMLNKWIYANLLDAVVASNSAIARSLEERLAIRASVIHGAVDEKRFNPDGLNAGIKKSLNLEPSAFLVGLLGRMAAHKGWAHFLDAAKYVLRQAPNVAFVLIVKNNYKPLPEVMERLKADHILADRVRVLGQCEDLPAILRDFGVGVVASASSEANCRVGLEWMASGVPLIATKVGVLPDIVEENETGFLVNPGRTMELAEKIVYLAKHPEVVTRMGAAARKSVEERFTLAAQADKFAGLIERTIAERACRTS